MKISNSFFKLLGALLVLLLLNSCGSQYHLASYYDNDPIYGVTKSGDSIRIDVIENDFEFSRKLRFDSKFRWDFANFAQNQPLSWYYRNFNQLGGWRSPFTPFDFYWNRYDYWWNWSVNMPFQWGFHSWNSPWYWNRWDRWYGYPHDYYWNRPFGNRGGFGYVSNDYRRDNRNISYNIGRRGSSVVVVTPNGSSRGRSNNTLDNNIRINRGRTYQDIKPDNRIPNPNDVDVVIEKPNRNFIGRFIDKLENNGVRVRTYQNPNNIQNNIRIQRNNTNTPRNYHTPPRTNNNIRSSSPPVRSSSPPVIRNNSGRSSGGVSISRGSRGKINQ
jgi:hypothetical protein